MNTRTCIRGCMIRGDHQDSCADYGTTDGECKGCVPALARDGVLICSRCYHRLRRHLDDAADLVAHIRSIADPTKAKQIRHVMASSARDEMPAPVDARLIDASADIVRTLRDWAAFIDGGDYSYRLAPGASAGAAYDAAHWFAFTIIDRFDEIANTTEITRLADAVLEQHGREPEWWSIADAMVTWPLDDRPHYAVEPCPECDLKMVWVTPPRSLGKPERYRCQSCDWESDDRDENGLWREMFASTAVEELVP